VPAFKSIPLWAWLGGLFAGFYLTASLIAIPRIGASAVFSLVIAGQLVTALLLDSSGAFGVPQISLSASRAFGVVLLLAGVMLLQRR
jgi:transporter family-2 protein